MDNWEAKFILNAYRPGGQDASDPRFAEAIEQARRDPILQRWFDESLAFDAAMTVKLCTVPVPGDLRENILAGAKVSRMPGRKNRLRKWAIAAVVVLSATLGSLIWHSTRQTHLAGWQSQALDVVSSLAKNESHFDAESHNAGELVAWLRANHAPTAERLPKDLGRLASIGCKTFSSNGTPISVICFKRTDGGLIHLVIMNASASDRALNRKPELVQQNQWATATWREGEMICMLALEGSLDQLRWYLL
jgi:hypothetical protein